MTRTALPRSTRTRKRATACALAAGIALMAVSPPKAQAQQARYGLFIGANHGVGSDEALRYAVSDARRLADLLTNLGNLPAENVVRLENPDPTRLREAMGRLNARIRSETAAGTSSVLFVFYSGHGDAEALRVSGGKLPWGELRNAVLGSAAQVRVLVVDACQSGKVTRVKGTRLSAPFALSDQGETPEGFAILSSAAADEAAQESDDLAGSFFTHHLVAALSGAADADENGQVTLGEAYAYSARRTAASTAETRVGLQHPTYAWDLKGRAEVTLTNLREPRTTGTLHLAPEGLYMVRGTGPGAPLVLEVAIADRPRRIQLPAGGYILQRRLANRLMEAPLRLAQGQDVDAGTLTYRSIAYDQLVRKGGIGAPRHANAAHVEASVGTGFVSGYYRHERIGVIYGLDAPSGTFDFAARLGHAGSSSDLLTHRHRITTLEVSAGFRKVWDYGRTALSAGLSAGVLGYRQGFTPLEGRVAAARHGVFPFLDSVLRMDVGFGDGYFWHLGAVLRAAVALKEPRGDEVTLQAYATTGVGTRW